MASFLDDWLDWFEWYSIVKDTLRDSFQRFFKDLVCFWNYRGWKIHQRLSNSFLFGVDSVLLELFLFLEIL